MKNYNASVQTISYQVSEDNPALINQAITKTFFESPIMKDIIKDDIHIVDLFSSGRNIYDAIPRNLLCTYMPVDISMDERFKTDQRVLPIISTDINKIKLDDAICDVIFAPASKVGYGKYHQSMFEIERIIKPGGYLIAEMSRFWFTRQFNQILFCSREWDLISASEINYMYRGPDGSNPTAKYYLVYRKR